MELKFCKFCGEKIAKELIVCPKCGRQLEELKKEPTKKEIKEEEIEKEIVDYKNLGLLAALIVFPPIGIVYLWTNFPKMKKLLKVVLTILFGGFFIIFLYSIILNYKEQIDIPVNSDYEYQEKTTESKSSDSTENIKTTTSTKAAKDEGTAKTTTNQTATKNESVSVSKMQAIKKAKSYIGVTAFSYKGLIEQLEYEGFSNEDATYGADNCGADWNTQAIKKAKSYLSFSAFSYKGLIEQLEYEKFTSAQAKYGADNCGADWYEQAEKKAASYMKISSFSRKSLIEQLEYEGFTADQAKHGADSVGL